jgi:hypothetical protein
MDLLTSIAQWVLSPPGLYFLSGIVAFVVASLAAQNWRELGILVLLVTALVFPIKWLGPMLGLSVLGEDAITWRLDETRGWVLHATFSAAVIAAIVVASVAMVAWKEIAARRQPQDSE